MALRFAADGKTLAVAGGEPGVWGSAAVWDLAEKKKIAEVARGTELFFDAAWSADGTAAGNRRRRSDRADVELARAKTSSLEFEAHADWVRSVAWSSDGKLLVTASRDKTARIHRAEDGHLLANFIGEDTPQLAALFTPTNEGFVLSGGSKGRVTEWFVETGDKYDPQEDRKLTRRRDEKETRRNSHPQEKFDAEYEAKHLGRANPFADGNGSINVLARYEDKLLVAAGKTLRLINCVNHETLHTYEGAPRRS